MQVFILCAGNGTRLYPYTDIMSKSMLRLAGVPIIRHIVNKLTGLRFSKINICINTRDLNDFSYEFRDRPDVQIHIEDRVVSTGTTYARAAMAQTIQNGEEVMIYYGDTILQLNLDKLFRKWEWAKFKLQSDALMVCSNNIKHDYSEVHVDTANNDMVIKMVEKPKLAYPSWTGILIMKHTDVTKLDFGFDFLPSLILQKKLAAYVSDGEYYDTGNIKAYQKLLEMGRTGALRL